MSVDAREELFVNMLNCSIIVFTVRVMPDGCFALNIHLVECKKRYHWH